MNSPLHYTDEADKSLGIAGMAIALVACDGERLLASVSVEPDDEPFDMAQEFFFSGNPRQSARIAWNELLRQYQIVGSLVIGNVLCRAYSTGHSPAAEVIAAMHDFIIGQAGEYCSLDSDEAEALYNKSYRYYSRLFAHPTVSTVARDFATLLRIRRTMSATEVLEQLSRLQGI